MKCVAKLRLLSQNSRRRFFRFNIIIFKILYNLGGRQQLLGQVFYTQEIPYEKGNFVIKQDCTYLNCKKVNNV